MQNLWRTLNSRGGVLPELPLTALLFPQGPPDELGNEKGLGVVALGPLGIGGLLVA
jgi:hypothetical protein